MTIDEKVVLITGSMFSKKSKNLIDCIQLAHITPTCEYLVFKPTSDTRDGLYVRSREYSYAVPAMAWDQDYKDMKTIFNYIVTGFALTNPKNEKMIFIDEAHFLSLDDMKFIVKTCKKNDIALVVVGLLTSFKLTDFEATKWLQDNYEYSFLNGNCNGCKEDNAIHNILFEDGKMVSDGDVNRPGDLEYQVLCDNCLSKLRNDK